MLRFHPYRPYCRCGRCKLSRRLDEIVQESADRVGAEAERIFRKYLVAKERAATPAETKEGGAS